MTSITNDKETFFTKAMIAVMLAAITVSSLVLGVVAVVAMNDGTQSASGESADASIVQVHLTEFAISMVPDTAPATRSWPSAPRSPSCWSRKAVRWPVTPPAWMLAEMS